ncbi:response regulator [Polaribacter litorisediminis]|uniref:hybrid sensor histidine kinase/response regulator transcription factor n=1 Tax=Polaribacter litorisediminis TaxID=1908341 RepID=UPI001CBD32CF|nr:response regulator [Polaribacter litorisediminis]UAM98316.1 response regulator [Polaribacter litorisediminis]
MNSYVIHLLFILNFLSSVSAQRLQLNALTVKDGLSQHDVSSIIQDAEGFIWIATYDGLNKFDGYQIENYFHDNNDSASLSSNRLRCLFEEKNKRIWIGTDGYGLNYYNLEKGSFTRVKVPVNYEIINDIYQNSEDEIIAATTQGLLKISQNNQSFLVEILQTPITGFDIKKIKLLENGNILYATNRGLWLSHKDGYSLVKGSDNISFNTIVETSNNQIWAAGKSGLYQIINNTLVSKRNKIDSNVLSMAEGIHNDLWITTFNSGLLYLSLDNLKVSSIPPFYNSNENYLYNKQLKYIFKDATNTLWISNTKGLVYSNLDSKKFKSLPIEKKVNVRTLFSKNDKIYYGLQAGRFYIYSFDTNSNKVINIPKNAKAFRVDTLNGKIYLATTSGLFREKIANKDEFERVPIFEDSPEKNNLLVTSFCKDGFGNQYFGTFKGLLFKDKKSTFWIHKKFKNLDYLRNVRVFSLKVDNLKSCIWVGTISEGLFKINLGKSGNILSVESYNEKMTGAYKIPNNSIWSFYQDKNNSLYVGTDTGLLLKKSNENEFKSVKAKGIQNKKIMGIISDESSNLWLNNSQGILKYNVKTKVATKYNYFDGLLTNSFTEAISKNDKGQLFFGNISGINYFKSGELENNPFPSKISFTNLWINNNKVHVDEEILGSTILKNRLNRTNNLTLNYKQNDFSIEFTSTNYANVKVNKYRYQLENYDKNWQVVDNTKRFSSYSNIPSGNYKLNVEATSPTGVWSNNIKTILITIKPAPWNTWWAYLLYFVLISTILFAFIYFWLNKEKLRNQIALSTLKNEQEKEINEMKLTFFTDVAHEFKTPLSLIIGPLNDLIKGNINKEYKEFCYNIVSRNTNRMMNLVNQLLDFRKVNSGLNILKVSRNDMTSFVKEITKSFAWQSKTREIDLKIVSPQSYYCHFDKDIVEKVIYNLLSNAFKYTPNKGTIEIEIKPTWKQELEYFVILIKDSGKGISQQDKKKIFQRHFHGKDRSSSGIGLHLTATLIEAHKGEINVLNSALGGTEFMITLPVSSKAFTEEEFLTKDDIPVDNPKDYIPGDMIESTKENLNEDSEKILIVEDDYDLRKYLKTILNKDYAVIEANNGKEGLNIALKEIPDIIITDVMMPELDGIEMCEQIKKNILVSHIPVLMLTAKTGDEFYNKGLKVGAWDYIAKPFNSAQLLQKVNNIIKTRNSFRQYIDAGSSKEIKNHYVSYDQQFVKTAIEIVHQKMAEPSFSAKELSEVLGLSRMQLHRKLKALVGLSTTAFINAIKIKKAIQMFDEGCDRVQEAMDAVGINSYAHFISLFKKEKEMTPSKYIELKSTNQ